MTLASQITPTRSLYQVGKAMGSWYFVDLDETPEEVEAMVSILARNTAHLAGWLRNSVSGLRVSAIEMAVG